MKFKKYLWGILYGFLLTAFTVYILMDTFVITRVYTPAPSDSSGQNSISDRRDASLPENSTDSKASLPENSTDSKASLSENSTDSKEPQTVEITDTMYRDGNISITITTYRENDTDIYVADIQLSSPEYLKTAFAQGAYGKNVTEKTSETAENNNAILAVNGDYYGSRESGYVLRNGVLYRSLASRDREDLVIYKDGSFSVITETEISARQLLADGAEQILSFGPALVTNGEISVSRDEEVGKAKASNPRTAIGIIDDLHYLHYIFVVSDGRTNESEGLSLYELAEFMQSIGSKEAYNLDGGGSSTMYFNGNIINNPTSSGKSIKERSVSDIVYIGY